jgi:integrase
VASVQTQSAASADAVIRYPLVGRSGRRRSRRRVFVPRLVDRRGLGLSADLNSFENPFIADDLSGTPDNHSHLSPQVSPTDPLRRTHGAWLRRSNMSRRIWRPAVNGTATTAAILDGMHFHDTRHTHKTWLIEDDIPEIAQAKRLGHRLPGIRGVYSHVTPVMTARITDSLQTRWTASHHPPTAAHTPPRRLHSA